MGPDYPPGQGLQADQGREALPGALPARMQEIGLPIIESRHGIPHQHVLFLPLAKPGGGPGIAVVQQIVPRPGLGQDQVHHIMGVPGGEGLALIGADHVIGGRDHLR